MIGIIDYGLGNISSFINIYKQLNIKTLIIKNPTDLNNVDKIILPGVGSFDWAMESLNKSGLRDSIQKFVIDEKKPILGVCVGMQIMAESSEEGKEKGLSWIDSKIKKFCIKKFDEYFPLPHMGWNNVSFNKNPLSKDIEKSSFYFLHSYFFDKVEKKYILARSTYSEEFTSAIVKNNIYGVQFHPEKSHSCGINLLTNFAKL